jgi:hypothetical protein
MSDVSHAVIPSMEMPFLEAQSANHMFSFRPYKWCFVWIILMPWFCSHQQVDSFHVIFVARKSTRYKTVKNRHFTSSSSTTNDNNEQMPLADPVLLSDNAPSWQDLWKRILDTPTGARLETEQSNRALGLGPPHTDALLRYFSENANNVRVTLYRDHAGESTDESVLAMSVPSFT